MSEALHEKARQWEVSQFNNGPLLYSVLRQFQYRTDPYYMSHLKRSLVCDLTWCLRLNDFFACCLNLWYLLKNLLKISVTSFNIHLYHLKKEMLVGFSWTWNNSWKIIWSQWYFYISLCVFAWYKYDWLKASQLAYSRQSN